MAKQSKKDKYIYCASGELSTGESFEAGDVVGDIPQKDFDALLEMFAIQIVESEV